MSQRHTTLVYLVCQSAEVDRSTLSSEQIWSSVFCCCGPVDLESVDSLRDPALSLNMFRRQLKTYFCEILTRCAQRRALKMRYTIDTSTYLLTYVGLLIYYCHCMRSETQLPGVLVSCILGRWPSVYYYQENSSNLSNFVLNSMQPEHLQNEPKLQ